jgi:hypothetical protein
VKTLQIQNNYTELLNYSQVGSAHTTLQEMVRMKMKEDKDLCMGLPATLHHLIPSKFSSIALLYPSNIGRLFQLFQLHHSTKQMQHLPPVQQICSQENCCESKCSSSSESYPGGL